MDTHIFFYFYTTNTVLHPLEVQDHQISKNNFFVCVLDSSSTRSPGYPMRNAILLACARWAFLNNKISFVSLRLSKNSISSSIYYKCSLMPITPQILAKENPSGWFKDEYGRYGPRSVDLSQSMDPEILCRQSTYLNLKLMNWRRESKINLEKIEETSCLIIGSGTLGCNIARSLMGWNVLRIGFVDNSRVSYSNLSRQSLYTFEDVSKPKAETAAMRVKNILPFVETEGYNLSVMVPERSIPLTETSLNEFERDFHLLECLIKKYDVIFLALDSREARWLPTVMCFAENKPVINVAIGFDTFCVQRHRTEADMQLSDLLEEDQVGCYFCSDTSVPSDLGSGARTLDQQCTTVRPGVSQVCAGIAVELLMAFISVNKKLNNGICTGSLGPVPNMVRGDVMNFEIVKCTNFRNKYCSACSSKIIEDYKEKGKIFVLNVCNSPNYLNCLVEDMIPIDNDGEFIEFSSD